MASVFFDFDGTIVNSQHRLYNLFCELCPENKMSYSEYWEIKRNHITQKEFLTKYFNYDDEKLDCFKKQWFSKVEEDARINQDFPVDGISDILSKLAKKYDLYLVTHRQDKNITENELKKFGWFDLFKKILVTEQKISKIDLIKLEVGNVVDGFFIGDTGEDVKTAHDLNIKSIAVTWGVLNKKVLLKYKPDIIIDDVNDFYSLGMF